MAGSSAWAVACAEEWFVVLDEACIHSVFIGEVSAGLGDENIVWSASDCGEAAVFV